MLTTLAALGGSSLGLIQNNLFAFVKHFTVNTTGETQVLNGDFPSLLPGESLINGMKIHVFLTFTGLYWQNPCFMLGKSLFSTRVVSQSKVMFTEYGLSV